MKLLNINHKTILFNIVICICMGNAPIFGQDDISYDEGMEQYRVIALERDNNATQSISNLSILIKSTSMYVPNAFSPDQEGLNDSFGAVCMNVSDLNMQIFNRWGELIFEGHGIKDKWDGTYNGSVVPAGVYVYIINAHHRVTDEEISKSGTVTLLM